VPRQRYNLRRSAGPLKWESSGQMLLRSTHEREREITPAYFFPLRWHCMENPPLRIEELLNHQLPHRQWSFGDLHLRCTITSSATCQICVASSCAPVGVAPAASGRAGPAFSKPANGTTAAATASLSVRVLVSGALEKELDFFQPLAVRFRECREEPERPSKACDTEAPKHGWPPKLFGEGEECGRDSVIHSPIRRGRGAVAEPSHV
jgi:hypothetical protein